MKFVALALTLLLAVGSHAMALQNDAPSQLEHVRAAAMVYLTQVKETAMKTLDHLDGTEYAEYKVKLSESLDQLHAYAQTASETITPYGETYSAQLLDATKDVRERIMADVEDLRVQLEPKREELRQVLQKHMDEYRGKLEPVFQEYMTKNKEDVETLRAKLQPLLEEMRSKVEANVEETPGPPGQAGALHGRPEDQGHGSLRDPVPGPQGLNVFQTLPLYSPTVMQTRSPPPRISTVPTAVRNTLDSCHSEQKVTSTPV
ncbi:apolipoprotein A-I isoform X2 [Hypomesus transpacificus]|uniref:apolipoprotein A-I isoform X2 n=1 Tax=Hypomesus transpacificus TaxID=137520 RepID=UPI001F074F4A|nr:apolipoprotein A-I isoform X2 [Hypomesus transpacificus]